MNAVLDAVLPCYDHRERHEVQVAAPHETVWRALHGVSSSDLWLTRILVHIRALALRSASVRSTVARRDDGPGFIDALLERGFRAFDVDAPSTFVAGAVGQPWRPRTGKTVDVVDLDGFLTFAQPGFVLMAVSFELETRGAGTRLSTETRVAPTDPGAGRAFRRYWWAIRAGSGLIRRDVLRAVRRRAEADASPQGGPSSYRR